VNRSWIRRLVILGCVLVVISTAGATAVNANVGGAVGGEATSIPPIMNLGESDEQQQNSSDTLHEDPNSIRVSGNASALEPRLAESLIDRLTRSIENIGDREYEDSQQLLADEYDDTVNLYMEVYRSMEGDAENRQQREDLFTETANLQKQYANILGEYEQTHEAYERARADDDENSAQRRARDLNNLTRELRQTEQSLIEEYDTLDGLTNDSLGPTMMTITQTTDETADQTDQIVQESYSSTSMTATAANQGSFANPITITGELTADDNTPPIGNASFLVNDQVYHGKVSSDGSFMIEYRPVTVTQGSAILDLAYVPDETALYLPSETTVETNIVQESPTMTVENATEVAGAGETIEASGQVSVDDEPVPNTTVTIRLASQHLGETQTEDDGTYRFETTMPTNISTGAQTLSIETGEPNTALAPTSESTTLDVAEVEPALTLSATREEGIVNVSGRLASQQSSFGQQDIVISLNGEQREIVQTNADGSYESSIELPQSIDETDSVTVQVAFDGSENLQSTSVGTILNPPGLALPDGLLTWVIAVTIGITAITGGSYGFYRFRSTESINHSLAEFTHPGSMDPAATPSEVKSIPEENENDEKESEGTIGSEDQP